MIARPAVVPRPASGLPEQYLELGRAAGVLDPADGKIYKAEVWAEDGKLKVRGYLGVFFKTQTWLKGN